MRNDRQTYKLIKILMILIALLMVGSLGAVILLLNTGQRVKGLEGKNYGRHYAFIHYGGDDEFWDSVYEGASRKGEEVGVYVQDFGKNLTVAYSRDELIQIAIDAKVDGLILDGESDEETAHLIEMASQAGIPVVTVMNDCANSARVCYVGISSYAMGRQYGERIMKYVPSSHKYDINVDVIMNSDYADSGQSLVISGIFDVFKENGYGDQLNIEAVYIDNSTAFAAEEEIRDIFLNGELPNAIVGLSSVYTRCLFQAAVDYNKVGDVLIYGFDDSKDILDAVSKNIVEATLAVNSSEMGASAVSALEEYISMGNVSEYISQDTDLIMADEAGNLLITYEDTEEID